MFWRDIISAWLSNKTRQDRSILDLIRSLVETNIIPEILVDNSMLQTILLTQIMLETLNGLSVPKVPQGSTFTYPLEEQTGVNLDHYYKLRIVNM